MTSAKLKIPKNARTLLWVLLDVALVNAALALAQVVRYSSHISYSFFENSLRLAPAMTVLFVLTFYAFGIYRIMWQYASASDVLRVAVATLTASLLTYAFSLVANLFVRPANLFRLHRVIYLLLWIITMAFVGGSRLVYRMAVTHERLSLLRSSKTGAQRVMVIGAGWAGASVVHEMQRGSYGNCIPVLVVDDDRIRTGSSLSGVPVVRGSGNILKLASDYLVDEIIIAIATPKGDLKPVIEKCLATGCRVRRVAPLEDVGGASGRSLVRDISINDLLGRPEEQLDMTQVSAFFRGKTVLITGGGGSIGSELCRKLLPLQPERIVLYDISENYMYDLASELRLQYGDFLKDKLILCVGSIRDAQRLDEIFARYQPQVVLHAAAHKHVPLMEDCPDQAVKNNVFGTWLTAQTAVKHHVERFVLISTDKAVNPTNVMGATKRLAEMIIEALNAQTETEFTAVRFGNVLGSHGSVVPLFERQIRSGGPVTLTHPDIIRYFMTIPEAASLVLQAASIAKGGELFVLDMGRPVKIRELAERMIQLYAPRSGARVDIVYTGLRPGEKLYEELLLAGEGVAKTQNEKIFIAKPEVFDMTALQSMLDRLQRCLDEEGDMLACLHELVPTFREADAVNGESRPKSVTEAAAV
ncbi:MAG: polysaccharide biosynthesis protein [Clostridiales bacterium]|nr:polysaccharide biosynthesis protein [Clostridiales bacterium]MDO4349927.1 nucleoside-diphosphate sugar epimerase/dehydratase [Eubacteriales bacterium]MDY4008149.1 nucleoside-diphosphate sugar epimerase/dehydratase [Candidatus Limiplasma sp.]